MKGQNNLTNFIAREWLLIISGIGLLITSFYARRLPLYSLREFEVLFLLFALMISVSGLQKSGLINRIAYYIQKGERFLPFKLVFATFSLSMFLTNDIILILIVPLTLLLDIEKKELIIILEAIAANAGSALTPFGNPQNLYIYWYYHLHLKEFIYVIAPFSLVFLIIISVISLFIPFKKGNPKLELIPLITRSAIAYSFLLVMVIFIVLHLLPVWVAIIAVLYPILFDKKALLIDYSLLVSFFFFFGLAENIKYILLLEINHIGHVFLLSALCSQIISNVPAALLFAKFTSNWQALLWGTNVGGFGSLFGSLANLIAYRLYINENPQEYAGFIVKFLSVGYGAFFISIGLYYLVFCI